ncbi:MAG: twin-arginine translocase TatA/TatE family subunit [Deltaproteobacteria bacterium]|nr:twin-arginine translocase TatA/TatE family subunit [Deltaproteobacteria bacterium]
MGLNFTEILIVIFVIVLVFGAQRLPQLGDALGRSVRNFKRSLKGDDEIDVTSKVKHLDDGSDKKT